MYEQAVSLTCGHAPFLCRNVACRCAVYGLAVGTCPLSNLLHTLKGCCRNLSVGLWAHIEQQVRSLTRCAYKQPYERFGALVVLVNELVAPHTVHCLASFERQAAYALSAEACFVLTWQVAFENLYILARERCFVVVVSNETLWLKTVYQCILLVELPVEWNAVLVTVPLAVEPYRSNLAIFGEQLGELLIHEVVVCRPVGFCLVASDYLCAGAAQWVFIACPVDVRVVEV